MPSSFLMSLVVLPLSGLPIENMIAALHGTLRSLHSLRVHQRTLAPHPATAAWARSQALSACSASGRTGQLRHHVVVGSMAGPVGAFQVCRRQVFCHGLSMLKISRFKCREVATIGNIRLSTSNMRRWISLPSFEWLVRDYVCVALDGCPSSTPAHAHTDTQRAVLLVHAGTGDSGGKQHPEDVGERPGRAGAAAGGECCNQWERNS